jgi:hypothetical protein
MIKNKKSKYLLFLLFIGILFFSVSHLVLALEVPLPGLGNNPTIADYLSYVFKFLIGAAAGLSLISFTVGAAGLIMSGDSAESASNAKDRMKNAIIGLILTMASFLIIQTINPSLKTIDLTPLPKLPGVYFTDGKKLIDCPQSVNDMSTQVPAGYNTINYVCSDTGEDKPLLLWTFNNPNYIGGVSVREFQCGQPISISTTGSLKWAFETSGVYFCDSSGCRGNMCAGNMDHAQLSSVDSIHNEFTGNIGGIRIVNDAPNDTYFGAILHTALKHTEPSVCTEPKINQIGDTTCINVNGSMPWSSADIFTLKKEGPSEDGTVTFYSKPWGTDTAAHAGYWPKLPQNQKLATDGESFYPPTVERVGTMNYDFTNTDVPPQARVKCQGSLVAGIPSPDLALAQAEARAGKVPHCSIDGCGSVKDCIGSMKISSVNFLVGIYPDPAASVNGQVYCETFTSDVDNFHATSVGSASARMSILKDIYIIPTE